MSAPLVLDNISVALAGARVVDGVSLRVDTGEIVTLLGANGAGKTTLLRTAVGLLPHEGVCALGGADPRTLNPRQRALRAAYLPQRPQSIWPVSVESLVALGRFAHGAAPDRLARADQRAVDAALEACALTPLRKRGMDHISGGEKARAHLARALAQCAPLLVLDEPTAGLDPAQALGVGVILRAHAEQGGAVLLSTHDIALAATISHRVVLLRAGRVIAEGPPFEALTSDALEHAFGRKGRLERIGGSVAAVFE